MKKSSKKTAQATTPVAASAVQQPVLGKEQVDVLVAYNMRGRFKKTEYQNRVLKAVTEKPSKTVPMYLLTNAEKGKLVHLVETDGSDIYFRQNGENQVFGSVKQLNELDPEKFEAKLLTPKQLVELLLSDKKTQVLRFKNKKSGEEVDVALLNKSTFPYFVGVTVENRGGHDHLRVINMEPSAKYNKPDVQWSQLRDVTDMKLVAKLSHLKK